MKIYSLVFDYDVAKMQKTGRPWAEKAYKNKSFIFEYTAASIATFLHHNPHLGYEILTDDVDLLSEKIDQYSVKTSNLKLTDARDLISDWTSHWYCFWPLIKSFDHFLSSNGVLKLDNDLTCLKPIDDLLKHEGAIVWRRERLCSNGRDYWGEKYAAQRALGTDNFYIYNTGVWGLSGDNANEAKIIPSICERLISVDISEINRFPESPGVRSKVFNTSDQVSNCYFLHEKKFPILEAEPWFEHHCYGHDIKKNCIERASYLRKTSI